MAAITAAPAASAPRLSWRALRRLRDLAGNVAAAAVTPHRASLRRLADMPLSLAGTGCIDFAAFHYVHMIGWAVTGVSLWLVEHLIADDDTGGSA